MDTVNKDFCERNGGFMLETIIGLLVLLVIFIVGYVGYKIQVGSFKEDETRQDKRIDSFKVLEVYQQTYCYVVKCEGRINKEIPQHLTTIEYVQKKEDMRLEVVVLTSYYTLKRWCHKDEKYYTSKIIEAKLYILEGSMSTVSRFFF